MKKNMFCAACGLCACRMSTDWVSVGPSRAPSVKLRPFGQVFLASYFIAVVRESLMVPAPLCGEHGVLALFCNRGSLGCSWLLLALLPASVAIWLFMVAPAPGCSWLLLAAPGCFWLLLALLLASGSSVLAVPGFSWLPLADSVCSWLLHKIFIQLPPFTLLLLLFLLSLLLLQLLLLML
jgi:hypothetical protein